MMHHNVEKFFQGDEISNEGFLQEEEIEARGYDVFVDVHVWSEVGLKLRQLSEHPNHIIGIQASQSQIITGH